MGREAGVERRLSCGSDVGDAAVEDVTGREEGEARVVGGGRCATRRTAAAKRARLDERVVVGDARPAEAPLDAEVCAELGEAVAPSLRMGPPRSACTVGEPGTTPCRVQVSSKRCCVSWRGRRRPAERRRASSRQPPTALAVALVLHVAQPVARNRAAEKAVTPRLRLRSNTSAIMTAVQNANRGIGALLTAFLSGCGTILSIDDYMPSATRDGEADASVIPADGPLVSDGPTPTVDGGNLCAIADFCDDFEAATTFLDVNNKWGDNSSDTAWSFMTGRNSRQAVRAKGVQVSPTVFEATLRHRLAAFASNLDLRLDVNLITSCEGCDLARVAVLSDSGGYLDRLVLTLQGGKLVPSRNGSRLGADAPVFPVGRWATVKLTVALPNVTLTIDEDLPFAYSMTPMTPGTSFALEIGPYRTAGVAEIDVGYDNIAVRSR